MQSFRCQGGLAKTLIDGQCDAEQREKLSSPKRWVTRLIGSCTLRRYSNVRSYSAVLYPVLGAFLTDKSSDFDAGGIKGSPQKSARGGAGHPLKHSEGQRPLGRQLVSCCVMLLPSLTSIVNTEHEASAS